MQFTDYVVQVQVVRRNDSVVVAEKSFKTAEARTKWLERNDDKIIDVLAYSDPQ